MKRQILIAASFIYSLMIVGQIEYGVKLGLNSIDLISNGIKVDNGKDKLDIDFQNSDYGHHIGIYTRIKFAGIYIEPAAIFNSSKVSYKITDYTEGIGVVSTLSEKYSTVDIPLNIGVKAGVFRLYGGPVAHIHIASSSDLIKFKNYSQKFKDAKYGYQAGFGFDLWKIRLDVAYEGNFSAFGDHITIGGNNYDFGTSASRIMGTVGYQF